MAFKWINVKKFHGSLTTVVRAQNDTPKTANITDTIFDRIEYWYSPYKRRRFENRSDQTFCIVLIKYALSVNLHSVTRPIAYYYYPPGTLRCLQKEMATYRHWSVSLWRDPDDVSHCRILSPDKTEWWLISATLCGWGRCFVADQFFFFSYACHLP